MCNNILRVPENLVKRFLEEQESVSYRNDFMRDRDRIMYCNAFRRLDGKTQIYRIGGNDHRRNRLTHTLEVAQIARTIAKGLGLDENLTEAIALGHDLGHTPFGHAGEVMLDKIMRLGNDVKIPESPFYKHNTDFKYIGENQECFGFKHNLQSARVVAVLENGYGNYGLNLTNYTIWGIMHHTGLAYKQDKYKPNYCDVLINDLALENGKQPWSFEAFVVAQADEIAQWHHDLEDALRSGAMSAKTVWEEINDIIFTFMSDSDRKNFELMKELYDKNENYDRKRFLTLASKVMVNTLVAKLVECSRQNLQLLANEQNVNENSRDKFFLKYTGEERAIKNAIAFDEIVASDNDKPKVSEILKSFGDAIKIEIHHSAEVEQMNAKGQYIIRKLFQAYATHPQQLPNNTIVQFMVETHKENQQSGENYENMESACTLSAGKIRTDFAKFWQEKSKGIENIPVKVCLMRKICDTIASMTDQYAVKEYEKLYG